MKNLLLWPFRYTFRIRERLSLPVRVLLSLLFIASFGLVWASLTTGASYIGAYETEPPPPPPSAVEAMKDAFSRSYGAVFGPEDVEEKKGFGFTSLRLVGMRIPRDVWEKRLPDIRTDLQKLGVAVSKCPTCGGEKWDDSYEAKVTSDEPDWVKVRAKGFFAQARVQPAGAEARKSPYDEAVERLSARVPFASLEWETVRAGGGGEQRHLTSVKVPVAEYEKNEKLLGDTFGAKSYRVERTGEWVVLRGTPRPEGRRISPTVLPSPREMGDLLPGFVNQRWKTWTDVGRRLDGVEVREVYGNLVWVRAEGAINEGGDPLDAHTYVRPDDVIQAIDERGGFIGFEGGRGAMLGPKARVRVRAEAGALVIAPAAGAEGAPVIQADGRNLYDATGPVALDDASAPWLKAVADLRGRGPGGVADKPPAPLEWSSLRLGLPGTDAAVTISVPALASNAEAFVDHLLFRALGPQFRDWLLLHSALATVSRVLIAFFIAAAFAVPLGIAMGAFTKVEGYLDLLRLIGLYVPLPALTSIMLFAWGLTETAKVGFLAICIFVVLLPQVVLAVQSVPQTFIDTALTLGATRLQIVRRVLVGVAKADIMRALRLSFGVGFTWVALAETINATSGFGYVIFIAEKGRMPRAYAYMVIISIIAIAFAVNFVWARVERRLFPYREADHS